MGLFSIKYIWEIKFNGYLKCACLRCGDYPDSPNDSCYVKLHLVKDPWILTLAHRDGNWKKEKLLQYKNEKWEWLELMIKLCSMTVFKRSSNRLRHRTSDTGFVSSLWSSRVAIIEIKPQNEQKLWIVRVTHLKTHLRKQGLLKVRLER